MSCACVYVSDDSDRPEFFSQKILTAKKQHRCCECGRDISPTEKYEYTSGLWEGDFLVFKTCEDCQNIRSEFFCEGWNFGYVLGDLYEYIAQDSGQISEDCILELSGRAREMIFEMIERIWEDIDA